MQTDKKENNGRFFVDPKGHDTWVAYMHTCCADCKNECGSYSNDMERINECLACIENLNHFYKNRKSFLFVRGLD